MTSIKLSKDAANYVRNETSYLKQRSPAAARDFAAMVKAAKKLLQEFPTAGNAAHTLHIPGNLVLVRGDYLFEYACHGDQLLVSSVRHGRTLVLTPDINLDANLEDTLRDDFEAGGPKI